MSLRKIYRQQRKSVMLLCITEFDAANTHLVSAERWIDVARSYRVNGDMDSVKRCIQRARVNQEMASAVRNSMVAEYRDTRFPMPID